MSCSVAVMCWFPTQGGCLGSFPLKGTGSDQQLGDICAFTGQDSRLLAKGLLPLTDGGLLLPPWFHHFLHFIFSQLFFVLLHFL